MFYVSTSEKKLVKPLKNCFLGLNLLKKDSLWVIHNMENNFFGRNNKSRSPAFRNFLFYQNIIFFDWVMNIFLSWVMFLVMFFSFSKMLIKEFLVWVFWVGAKSGSRLGQKWQKSFLYHAKHLTNPGFPKTKLLTQIVS